MKFSFIRFLLDVCSLTAYAIREGGQQNIAETVPLFDIFSEQIAEVVKVRRIEQRISHHYVHSTGSSNDAIRRYRCFAKRIAQSVIEMLS